MPDKSASLGITRLDDWQETPYGTHAWALSYGRRNIVEGVFSQLQRRGFDRESVLSFGVESHGVGAVFLAVAHHLEQAASVIDDEVTDDEMGRVELPEALYPVATVEGATDPSVISPDPPPKP